MKDDSTGPEEAITAWRLGWACGYNAALRGDPDPSARGQSSEMRVHAGDDWKHGYKQGYACGKGHKECGVKIKRHDKDPFLSVT